MKLKVKPEGRAGIWLAEKRNVAAWIKKNLDGKIHNFIASGPMLIGADWSLARVIDCVKKSDRIAILTDDAARNNMNHSLSVVSGNRLDIFDIGKITEKDLQIA